MRLYATVRSDGRFGEHAPERVVGLSDHDRQRFDPSHRVQRDGLVVVVELYDRLGTADEVSLSRQHFVILRELANKMMLQTAADALAAEQAPDTLH